MSGGFAPATSLEAGPGQTGTLVPAPEVVPGANGQGTYGEQYVTIANGNQAPTQEQLSLLNGVVGNILNLAGTREEDIQAALGTQEDVAGYGAEATAYGEAAGSAQQNAVLAQAAGQVQQFQTQRQARQTIGTQQATIAAAGFKNAGSALMGVRSSVAQAALQQQMIQSQTNINQSGYLAQAAASTAEETGANVASSAAQQLMTEEQTAASTAGTNMANEVAALSAYEKLEGMTSSPEGAVITSVLAGTPSTAPASIPGSSITNPGGGEASYMTGRSTPSRVGY